MEVHADKQLERRKYKRLPKKYLLYCTNVFPTDDESLKIAGEVKDIGGGGVLFSSPKNYAVAEVLEIELNIPGWQEFNPDAELRHHTAKHKPLIARGVVRRTEKKGPHLYDIAVEFLDMDRRDRLALMAAILHK